MILFFVSDISTSKCTLEEDEFQHCCKVLRNKVDDTVFITDGQGVFAQARIVKVNKRNADLEVLSKETKTASSFIKVLCVAPPKNRSRWEWLLEKSVEIGVDVIIPMTTGNSERVKLNIERSQKIMRSAALQSKRIIHPSISEITSFDKIISNSEYSNYLKLIAHFKEENEHIIQVSKEGKNKIILVGPEGDFRPEEIEKALTENFKLVNISQNRLRTETAALVCVNFL